METLKYKKLVPNAKLYEPALVGDQGFDICSLFNYIILPGESAEVFTGIALQLPVGYYADVRTKSGLGFKGLQVHCGLIDEGYLGEVTLKIFNHSKETQYIGEEQKVAQIVLQRSNVLPLEEVQELVPTVRGNRCKGSTGK